MAQYIYLIAAMLGMMTLIMTSQRGAERTRQTEMVNEVSTQLTNAAAEVLERVGRSHFDQYNAFQQFTYMNNTPGQPYAYCGRIPEGQQSTRLAAPAVFGTTTVRWTGAAPVRCTSFATCGWIEGFHDLNPGVLPANPDLVLTRGDFRINFEVRVGYVNVANYADAGADTNSDGIPDGLATPTFAKQVTVTAHTPDAYLGDDPNDFANQLRLSLVRVFTYTCPTAPNSLPLPAGGQTCTTPTNLLPTCAVDNGA